jgi:O-antigen biosynthesis protein
MRLKTLGKAALHILRTEGLVSLFVRSMSRLTKNNGSTGKLGAVNFFKKKDVIGFYDFVLTDSVSTTNTAISYNVSKKSISWLIPDFGIGSGGHLNIFRYHLLNWKASPHISF